MGLAFDGTGIAACGVGARGWEAFEEALARLSGTVDEAVGRERSWLSRLRAGLVAFLGFCEDEPWCARVLLCEKPVKDEVLALRRQLRVVGVLSALLDDGCPQALGELSCEPQLSVELVAGGVVAVIRKRILEGEGDVLVALAPSLMAFIVAPFLGQAVAHAELTGTPVPAEQALAPGVERHLGTSVQGSERELTDLVVRRPGELPIRVTRRTLLVLNAIAGTPGSSNRQIADVAGVSDEGQTSRLLGRLQSRGLLENVGVGAVRGEANAWLLTARGRQTLRLIGAAQNANAASLRARRMRGSA